MPSTNFQIYKMIAGLGIAVLLVFSVYAAMRWRGQAAPGASPLTIEVTASPEGSEIFIDGNSAGISTARKDLPAGKHVLLVSRSGYRSWEQPVEVSGSLKLPVTLQPLPMDLRIFPNSEKVEVWLDDKPQASLIDANGAWVFPGIEEGMHTIRIVTGAGESSVSFDFRNGNPAAPALPQGGPVILFASGVGGNVRAECNCNAELQVGNSSQALVPGTAATFPLAEGKHAAELSGLPDGKKAATITMGPDPAATLAFFWPVKAKPAMDINTLLNSSLNLLKDARCDPAQANIDQVLARAPDNVDALGISRRIDRLRSVGGCRK